MNSCLKKGIKNVLVHLKKQKPHKMHYKNNNKGNYYI